MIIGKDDSRSLDRDEVIKLYAEYRQLVGIQIAPILNITETDATVLFPDP